MNKTVKLILSLLAITFVSCTNEEPAMYGSYSTSILNLSLEDELGRDFTTDINFTVGRLDSDSYPSYSETPSFDDKDPDKLWTSPRPSILMSHDGILCLITYCSTKNRLITIHLFENDTEAIELTGTLISKLIYNKKDKYFEWEFKGQKLPMNKKTHETNVTLIRHNDGTYSLKE